MKKLTREDVCTLLRQIIADQVGDKESKVVFYRIKLAAIDRLAKLENWLGRETQGDENEQLELNFESEISPEHMAHFLRNGIGLESEEKDVPNADG